MCIILGQSGVGRQDKTNEKEKKNEQPQHNTVDHAATAVHQGERRLALHSPVYHLSHLEEAWNPFVVCAAIYACFTMLKTLFVAEVK